MAAQVPLHEAYNIDLEAEQRPKIMKGRQASCQQGRFLLNATGRAVNTLDFYAYVPYSDEDPTEAQGAVVEEHIQA